jgi:hypothetical protein
MAFAPFVIAPEGVSAAEERLSIAPELVHVRSGDVREWSSFPEVPQLSEIAVEFESAPNDQEWTLRLRQQDVKQSWQVAINDSKLAELVRDENDQVLYIAVPAGSLAEGTNTLTIRQSSEADAPDDIRVGEIGLIERPVHSALDEGRVAIRIVDIGSGLPIPSRVTVTDENGSLHPVAVAPNDLLAVRAGVIYTGNGSAEFSLPAGRYTVFAGRGFEYSLARVDFDLRADETATHTLSIHREVPTDGYVACDTHVHTLTFSGHGDASIEERMVTIAGEGIELPIATDHNIHIDYAPYARELNLNDYFTPVIGNEFTTPVGHFNVFPILAGADVPDHNHTSWQSAFDKVFTTPGVEVAVLNHARDLHSGVRPFGPDHFNDAAGISLDGWPYRMRAMEVVNSAAIQTDGLQLFRDWMTLLNAGYSVTPIGGSDSHDVARHFVGQGRTYIRCADDDAGHIDVAAAVDSLLAGRVMVAYGLLAELTVDHEFTSGDTAPVAGDEFSAGIRVLGPHWANVERIQLYANGELIEDRAIERLPADEVGEGVIWQGEFTLPTPAHDQHLVAIAIGPGIEGLYWPTAKPYQPTSPDWEPHTLGCSGAVWLDADGQPGFTSARDYAASTWLLAEGDFQKQLGLLSQYDAATAAQAAAFYHTGGGSPTSDEYRSAMTSGPASVQAGFQRYFHAWRAGEVARSGD